MKLAVTYENGQVFQHFGHTEFFKIYEIDNGEIKSSKVISAGGSGHGALAGLLKEYDVETLICGGIGGGARTALSNQGIDLFPGVVGNADESVTAYLKDNLAYDPNTMCNHHGEGHTCGNHDHSCGEDKHGCNGNN